MLNQHRLSRQKKGTFDKRGEITSKKDSPVNKDKNSCKMLYFNNCIIILNIATTKCIFNLIVNVSTREMSLLPKKKNLQ